MRCLLGSGESGDRRCIEILKQVLTAPDVDAGALFDAIKTRLPLAVVKIFLAEPRIKSKLPEDPMLFAGALTLAAGEYCVVSMSDDIDIVRYILSIPGASVNARANQGNTALHEAARWARRNMVTFLLSLPDTDKNAQNESGKTPLMLAIRSKDIEIITTFLTSPGVDFYVKDKDGLTALSCAAQDEHVSFTTMQILLTHLLRSFPLRWTAVSHELYLKRLPVELFLMVMKFINDRPMKFVEEALTYASPKSTDKKRLLAAYVTWNNNLVFDPQAPVAAKKVKM